MNTRRAVIAGLFLVILSIMGLVASGAGQDVQTINQAIKDLGASWIAGETSISKLPPEERMKRCGTFIEEIPDSARMAVPISKIVLPEHFDWRDVDGNNWTTSIQNQGGCGSCWDFSVVGVFEMLLDYASGNPTDSPGEDLSEQYVLSCCDYCGSCGGGSPGSAFNFLQETGTVTEVCLPYSADDSIPCENACGDIPQQIGAWTYIYNDVESIKRAIYQFGSASACFTVYEDFSYYTNGVYEHVWGNVCGGHAISIVGWDDADQAWICKNSWGTGWGETIDGNPNTSGADDGGWFRIKWSSCGINNSVIMATLTSWPSGIVDVTVLDGLGHPVEYAAVYVNGDWYGRTSHGGTVSLDLIEGMNYEITAFSSADHFVLFGQVVAPGIVTLDCRDASYVTATANKLDGSPLDVGLYFQIGDWRLWCPEHTYAGTGWFYITPGVYDLQALSWWDSTDSEQYNLFVQDVDLTSSISISIDASAMPTGRFTLQTLLDFSGLNLVVCPESGWCFGRWMEEGDSLVCSAGTYWTYTTLAQQEGDSATWYYHGPDVQQALAEGQTVVVEAGGDLSLSATPGQECYEPGGVARILTQMTDGFGNPVRWVERYDDTPLPPPPVPSVSIYRLGPDGELEAFQSDGSPTPRTWDNFNPWMVVTSPSAVKIIDNETCLGCSEWIYLDIDAELGTYDIRVTQETHTGQIEGISSFEVALPGLDPYEPNDTCEAAYDLGDVPPAFTSDVAHFYDENEDWFTFNLTASGLLVIDTQLLGSCSDTMLYLYNTCGGELLVYNDDYESLASHIEYRAAPGRYYLLIDQCGQWYGGNTDYTFTIDLLPAPSIAVQGDDPIQISIPAGSIQDFSGLIGVTNVGQAGSTLNYRILQQEIPLVSSSMTKTPPTREEFRELFPVDSLELRSFKGEPPTGDWDLLFIDADESPTGGVDLKELYAQIDNGILYFKGRTYEAWADSYNLGIGIFLDIDQDSSTGCNTDMGWMNMNDIGAEYALDLPYGYLREFSNEWWPEELEYVSMPNDTNEFVVGVALSDLLPKALSETGGIDILFLLQDFSAEYPDYAPDAGQGHVTYPPSVSWLMQTPDSGTVAQGGMESITLTVDATDLVPGTARHVRLFFLSNDGSIVPTRDIEVTVEPPACQDLSNNLQPAGWHMISLPGELCTPCVDGECGDLICALDDDLEPCFIFHYDPGVGGYVMAPPPENICYHTGMGFWTRTYEDSVLIDAEVTVLSDPVEIPLGNGWNQIGNPFNFEVSLSNVTVKYGGNEVSLQQAQSNGWVSAYLFGYDTASGGYQMINPPDDCLAAWRGYWLRAYRDGCVLIISPTECSSSATTGQPLSTKELRARGLEIPPPPPNDLMNLDVKEVLAGLTVRNVPNPIRSEHTTTFKVEGKGTELVQAIRVDIYNQAGQRVFTQDINAKELDWHTDNDTGELLANGVYLYQVWVKIGDTWYPTGVHKLAVVR